MSLSPLETKFLEIRSFPENKRNSIFSFELAIRVNVTQLLADQIKYYAESDKGSVINIYGPNKSGRTTTAKTLATLIDRSRDPEKKKRSLCVTLNFLEAHTEIEQDDIMIIEQGEKLKTHKEKADTFGLEQIINACNNNNAIAIIVSDQKLIKDSVQADYYLKCEAIDPKKQTTYCILEINKFSVGYVEVFRLHNDVIERGYELAKEEFMKSEVQRILENIDETTQEVLKRWKKRKEIIFAENPKDIDKEDPAILFIPVIILGGQGEGKSTLSKILVNVLTEYYGVHSVHSLRHERDLTGMIQTGFSSDPKKYIQIFVANDFTFTKAGLGDLQEYSKIRHYMCDKARIKQGLAIPFMLLHYLTGKGSDVSYRNLVSFMFVLNPSDHDYTRNNILSKLMPEPHLKFLDYIVNLREQAELDGNAEEFLRLKGFGVCVIKGVSYPFYFNRKDYPIAHIESYESSSAVSSEQINVKLNIREVNDAFLRVFRTELKEIILKRVSGVNPKHLKFFIEYYASEEILTDQQISDIHLNQTGEELNYNSVGKARRKLEKQIDNTTLGICLESTMEKYLRDSHQQNYIRGTGGRKQADLKHETIDQAINCKFFLRPETTYNNLECTPENKHKDSFICLYDRKTGLQFYHNKESKAFVTCRIKNKLSVDDFINKFLMVNK